MADKQLPARTRFAPSPTGRLHLGSGRTALYAYLLARQTNGQFLLRLEDTDLKRTIPGSEEEIVKGLRWLGLEWDEGFDIGGPYGPYRQSERSAIYLNYAMRLIESGHAFYCFCTPQRLDQVRQEQQRMKIPPHYDGTCRHLLPDEASQRVTSGEKHVIRFKMPKHGAITVVDEMRGPITVENHAMDDYILVRSDGLPVYHLAAMVDDFEMRITHVFRGSEWLATFPLHIHILDALELPIPKFYHLSVFLKPTGKGKMSKRESSEVMKDGHSIFLTDLQQLGYLPEATLNWLALMGWSYDDKTEFFTLPDLVQKFDISHLNPAPAAINFTKFDHFNGLHIRKLTTDDLVSRMKPFFIEKGYVVNDDMLTKIAPIIQERIAGLDEAPEIAGFFFLEEVHPEPQELIGKNMSVAESITVAQRLLQVLMATTDFSTSTLESKLRALVDELGLKAGQVFGILRIAVTGQSVSPPLFESLEIIGREKAVQRVQKAIHILENL
jgi:glutamyl-tRNA synthetase